MLFILLNNAVAERVEFSSAIKVPVKNLQELGLRKDCITEPIFNGRACIFEINKQAKESVVLVHGLNSQAGRWYEQVAALKSQYHLISFDLPGFGESSRGNKLYSPTNYAKFIRYVAQKYIGKPFYLVGHSMGGAIALRYSEMYPADVNRLVLADVGGVLHQYSFAKSLAFKWLGILKKITYDAFPTVKDLPIVQDLMSVFFQNLDALPIDVRDALRIPKLRAVILNGNSAPIASVAVSSEDFSGAIRTNNIPTLILWGAFDFVTPIRTAEILQIRMSKAYIRILSRSAHSSMTDQPVEFNKLMLAHFSQDESKFSEQYWHFPAFIKSQRIGRCKNEHKKTFTGNYHRIELMNCSKVLIKDANVGSIVATNSAIEMEASQIISEDIGVSLFDSSMDITGSNITANIGIQTVRSHLDVAGVDFKIENAAVNSLGQSDAVFSVCNVNGEPLHTYKDFTLEGKI